MIKKYDAIILLGTEPDLRTWEFPEQIHQCLDRTVELVKGGVADKVIVSGKWSRRVENQDLKQPFAECDRMAELLIAKGIAKSAILRERVSTDTISNLYCVKRQLLIPLKLESLLFVVADFRVPRLKFLARKVLGPSYRVAYETVPAEEGPSYDEAKTIRRTAEFLAPMRDGDHEWLEGKFFKPPFY